MRQSLSPNALHSASSYNSDFLSPGILYTYFSIDALIKSHHAEAILHLVPCEDALLPPVPCALILLGSQSVFFYWQQHGELLRLRPPHWEVMFLPGQDNIYSHLSSSGDSSSPPEIIHTLLSPSDTSHTQSLQALFIPLALLYLIIWKP